MAMNIKKGDTVVVLSGKDKGKQGKVQVVIPSDRKVVVEGVNIVTCHVKPRKQGETGGIVVEADIGAVGTTDALGAADDDSLDNLALLHSAAGSGLADGSHDHITDVAELPLGAAQDTDALDLLGAGIIGNLQKTFLLNHTAAPPYFAFSMISTTRQRLSLDRGRVSITFTVSPMPQAFCSS